MSITFQPFPHLGPSSRFQNMDRCSTQEATQERTGRVAEATGSNATKGSLVKGLLGNAFVEAAGYAYTGHFPFELSPDTVWLCIAQGLAAHVNQNAETLRHHFVSHKGKKRIDLVRDSFVKGSPDNDWPGLFDSFSRQIQSYIGDRYDLIVSNFSTTGPVEQAASEVVLMDAMQQYFKYGFSTATGFPEITLRGEASDWIDIRGRIQQLAEFGLDWWTKPLSAVADKLVDSAKGDVDLEFWKGFYNEGGGSGGPFVTGWINALFPYLGRGGNVRQNRFVDSKRSRGLFGGGPTSDKFSSGLAKAPVTWTYHGTKYPYEFLGGFVGISHPKGGAVAPAIGWAVREAE